MAFNIPATPHRGVVCNQETYTKIPYNLQKRYWGGIGSLIYLVKHSQPELSNAVHELSKCMDESNMSHFKALICSIKYVIDTEYCF